MNTLSFLHLGSARCGAFNLSTLTLTFPTMKKHLLLCILLLSAIAAHTQESRSDETSRAASQPHLPCLHDLAVEHKEAQFPGYKKHVAQVIQTAVTERRAKTINEEVYTIPVVVHVVWKLPEENIPEERIEAQIRVLNEAYRRQNPDTVNTRDIFLPVVGDAKIEFVLTEVVRVQTNEFFQPTFTFSGTTLPDKVKRSAQGGSDAVDPVHHLNIWVCAIRPLTILGNQSPILGYAYPPAGLAHWPAGTQAPAPDLEGVVVDYRVVGDSLSYNAYGLGPLPMRGRTTVHEVGHYLGLRHISGDGLLAILGVPDCDADDGVEDTPQQGRQSQFDCNQDQNTCNDGAGDLPDMIENYMDYSRETCQNSFTMGQIEIMRAVLEGPRSGLIEQVMSSASTLAATVGGTVFPNPSGGLFELNVREHIGAYIFSVTDMYGRTLLPPQAGLPQQRIDLSGYPAGLYYLQVKPAAGMRWTAKLVLR